MVTVCTCHLSSAFGQMLGYLANQYWKHEVILYIYDWLICAVDSFLKTSMISESILHFVWFCIHYRCAPYLTMTKCASVTFDVIGLLAMTILVSCLMLSLGTQMSHPQYIKAFVVNRTVTKGYHRWMRDIFNNTNNTYDHQHLLKRNTTSFKSKRLPKINGTKVK